MNDACTSTCICFFSEHCFQHCCIQIDSTVQNYYLLLINKVPVMSVGFKQSKHNDITACSPYLFLAFFSLWLLQMKMLFNKKKKGITYTMWKSFRREKSKDCHTRRFDYYRSTCWFNLAQHSCRQTSHW